mmetsp:Transcript_2559/g.6961  ORF Transcript_2559/g.6961 Transcript_2559/m.6961 type:complete len:220 (+) Transcript_2559:662-1321(+)
MRLQVGTEPVVAVIVRVVQFLQHGVRCVVRDHGLKLAIVDRAQRRVVVGKRIRLENALPHLVQVGAGAVQRELEVDAVELLVLFRNQLQVALPLERELFTDREDPLRESSRLDCERKASLEVPLRVRHRQCAALRRRAHHREQILVRLRKRIAALLEPGKLFEPVLRGPVVKLLQVHHQRVHGSPREKVVERVFGSRVVLTFVPTGTAATARHRAAHYH